MPFGRSRRLTGYSESAQVHCKNLLDLYHQLLLIDYDRKSSISFSIAILFVVSSARELNTFCKSSIDAFLINQSSPGLSPRLKKYFKRSSIASLSALSSCPTRLSQSPCECLKQLASTVHI